MDNFVAIQGFENCGLLKSVLSHCGDLAIDTF